MSPSLPIYMDLLNGLLKPRFVTLDPSLFSSAEKDYAYCLKRFSAEGIRFLTVSLPTLRKAVDLSFKTGFLETPKGFGLLRSSKLPSFLSSHFIRIYDTDGVLLSKPNVTRIKHVRQVLESFYKLELPYSASLESATLENFVNNECRIRSFLNNENLWSTPSEMEVLSGAALLCWQVFEGFDARYISPRHGPGSLATGEKGEEKWKFSRLYNQIHQSYPYYEYFFHSTNMLGDLRSDYMSLERLQNGVSKITLVPKDSRGPRIITMEPLEYMWLQQGVGRKMMSWLETKPLTKGHINFTDQTVNQNLALNSSLSGEYATLDMKDASDLLSVDVVKLIFRLKPGLLKRLLALRTPETSFPDNEKMTLKKFAGMGSALCFPVESFCFWALCVSAIANATHHGLRKASASVFVFGDDIIVPNDKAEVVISALHSVGLQVNSEKSYYSGAFRESCGVDAYASFNVTPTRFRKMFPVSSDDGTAFAAWTSYANVLTSKGYVQAAQIIWSSLENIFGLMPYGTKTSPFPCRIVDDPADAERRNKFDVKLRWRVSKDYQRLEFRVRTLVPVTKDSELDSWSRLNRDILSGTGDEPSKFTLPRATKVVRGWFAV